jgi:hypothetical protein
VIKLCIKKCTISGKDAVSSISVNQKDEKQIVVSTFNTSLYETKDGVKNWDKMITSGVLN